MVRDPAARTVLLMMVGADLVLIALHLSAASRGLEASLHYVDLEYGHAESLQGLVAVASLDIVPGVSRSGGGSSPTGERETRLLAVTPRSADPSELERVLRTGTPPVLARVQDGALLLDLRTVPPEQDEALRTH